jgi:shikimate dehydrogenase
VIGVRYAELIGDPVAHSKSPLIHKFWLEKLGIDGDYRAVQVRPGELSGYFAARRADPLWRGCNVTMPHKQSVLPCLARLDPAAKRAAAVNTIVRSDDESRHGFNTDVRAVAELLLSHERRPYPNHVATYVQIIGAGGAAKAAAIGAFRASFGDLEFYNRTLSKARAMAAWAGLPPDAYGAPLEALGPIRNPGDGLEEQRYSHVIINASSMGMEGFPEVPVDLSLYYPDTVVFDMVYHPLETGLLRQARALGLRMIDGLQMLVAQAAHAFVLFFGVEPPREHDDDLRELLTS